MNKQITALAEQAFESINAVTTEGIADRSTFDQAWFQHYNHKFAELIVRECIEQLDDGDSHTNSNYWAIKRIKEHFGVE